ncbi:hypothetical protein [Haloplanus aerogenes]|uniref:Uncharacterized protein n=1 Tax=Haloplanus aerogenes TaxID=660522 RepID=A0A3M0DS30_9EURY|nr:hypothetical protein [Haloplanus aerogenes]AZH24749.1 hypothetical protein DU502_04825 [Haloplanus aerogenes]RMB23590.1 hypothetical protein ATH50_0809 [Haloplanus aerogenes]
MTDSNARDSLEATHERNREQRLTGIKRWVDYIKSHEPDDWGAQQNRLVDSQLESARQSDIDIEHRQRVDRAGRERSR